MLEAELVKSLPHHKLSLEEFEEIKKTLKRLPSFVELGVFSAMWSEHCSYKSSRIHLRRLPSEGPHVVVGPGENAGIVRISGKLCVAFKMESHNHPSYIEPFQGAATGVGGILRDVFCMGARPFANLNCLRFGSRKHPKTPYLFQEVVRGIGDYGNCVGIPTVGGNIRFDSSYDGNCLVNAMSAGFIHEDKIFKGYASGVGNLVIYCGSATGRDGIHGAAMASDSFQSQTNQERSAVQVGDPFAEKLLLEATLDLIESGLVVGLQDMGAAGLTSSSFEMASRANNGLEINLDLVPLRAHDMSAYEILLSESQERMLLVITPENQKAVEAKLSKWDLSYAVIGKVTSTARVQMKYRDAIVVDLPVDFVTDEAPKYDKTRIRQPLSSKQNLESIISQKIAPSFNESFLNFLSQDDVDYEEVWKQYDHHIGLRTILGPEEDGAAVVSCEGSTYQEWMDASQKMRGVVLSTACNEQYMAVDAKQGASHAVLKSARSIYAVGGTPIAITDCLNFGNPNDPHVMQDFSDAVDGISEACKRLHLSVVSGNVSLYNQTDKNSIKATPMIGCVGIIENYRDAKPAKIFSKDQSLQNFEISLLIPKKAEFSFEGSNLAKQLDLVSRTENLPPIDWEAELEAGSFITQHLSKSKDVLAIRDVGSGGIAQSLRKTLANKLHHREYAIKYLLDVATMLQKYFPTCSKKRLMCGEHSGAYVVVTKIGSFEKIFSLGSKHLKHLHWIQVVNLKL